MAARKFLGVENVQKALSWAVTVPLSISAESSLVPMKNGSPSVSKCLHKSKRRSGRAEDKKMQAFCFPAFVVIWPGTGKSEIFAVLPNWHGLHYPTPQRTMWFGRGCINNRKFGAESKHDYHFSTKRDYPAKTELPSLLSASHPCKNAHTLFWNLVLCMKQQAWCCAVWRKVSVSWCNTHSNGSEITHPTVIMLQ